MFQIREILWNLQLIFDINRGKNFTQYTHEQRFPKTHLLLEMINYWISFNEDVPDEKKCRYHKRYYQDYTNKQKLERMTKKQNEEGDLLRRSSRIAGKMGKKNMDVRSSRSQMFFKIGVLKNFSKFARKNLFQSLFFNKAAGPWQRCFPVNFEKFLRTLFSIEQLRWLLLGRGS